MELFIRHDGAGNALFETKTSGMSQIADFNSIDLNNFSAIYIGFCDATVMSVFHKTPLTKAIELSFYSESIEGTLALESMPHLWNVFKKNVVSIDSLFIDDTTADEPQTFLHNLRPFFDAISPDFYLEAPHLRRISGQIGINNAMLGWLHHANSYGTKIFMPVCAEGVSIGLGELEPFVQHFFRRPSHYYENVSFIVKLYDDVVEPFRFEKGDNLLKLVRADEEEEEPMWKLMCGKIGWDDQAWITRIEQAEENVDQKIFLETKTIYP
ncbi:hypothetical protein niasHT_019809 [Heterodera trifolii]|uniref:Uncharacterized protein n=1 Tax=Heterodera trifolii TaxID=157864 RepID=A0ABD2KUQ6_9BILA